MTPIPLNSPSMLAAVRLAVGSGGIHRDDIGKALGLCPKYTGRLLAVAKRLGLVESVCLSDCTWLWMSPAEAELLRLRVKVQRRQRERERHREFGNRVRRAAGIAPRNKPARPVPAPVEVDDSPMVRRVGVDPRAPLPFVCRAAASVFHLGGGL